jgi:hypothetical protein
MFSLVMGRTRCSLQFPFFVKSFARAASWKDFTAHAAPIAVRTRVHTSCTFSLFRMDLNAAPNNDCGGGGSDVARLGLGVGPILVGGAKVGSVYGEADDWIAVDCDDDTNVDAVGGDEAGEAAKAPADGIGFSTIVSICVSKIGKKQITNTSYLSLRVPCVSVLVQRACRGLLTY